MNERGRREGRRREGGEGEGAEGRRERDEGRAEVAEGTREGRGGQRWRKEGGRERGEGRAEVGWIVKRGNLGVRNCAHVTVMFFSLATGAIAQSCHQGQILHTDGEETDPSPRHSTWYVHDGGTCTSWCSPPDTVLLQVFP